MLKSANSFDEIYACSAAIGARGIDVLRAGGPLTNVNALCHRFADLARENGYNPVIMFYSAHGEADAATSMSQSDYYEKASDFYAKAQLYAAQAMQKPEYVAPVVLTYPVGAADGESTIKAAIRQIAKENKGMIDAGSIYQWPVNTDKTHPTAEGYVSRGEFVGYVFTRLLRQ